MEKGETAPLSYTIPGTKGDQEFQKYTLSDFIEDGPLVLHFIRSILAPSVFPSFASFGTQNGLP